MSIDKTVQDADLLITVLVDDVSPLTSIEAVRQFKGRHPFGSVAATLGHDPADLEEVKSKILTWDRSFTHVCVSEREKWRKRLDRRA